MMNVLLGYEQANKYRHVFFILKFTVYSFKIVSKTMPESTLDTSVKKISPSKIPYFDSYSKDDGWLKLMFSIMLASVC